MVAEEANFDEAVTAESKTSNNVDIDLKEERKTQAYEDTINNDIENNDTFEKKKKIYTTQWSTIYEVIEPEFLKNF